MICRRFADRFTERVRSGGPKACIGIFMYGGFGSGKTHLASAICNRLRDEGYSPTYINAGYLFDLMRASSGINPIALMQKLSWQALVVVDEIGRSSNTEFERSKFVELFDRRRRLGLPTIFITNLGMNAFADVLGGVLVSRTTEKQYPVAFN